MKYELNLDKEEYLDDYLSDDKDNNSSEFWQNNARSTLISNLYTVLHDAKKYGQYRTNTNQHNTW
ncbi:hypothetical protein [Shewanella surugensis]|uniref:Uncharacterized protein n=1 Tax=Shewanella surugensis TaxID=212020 RepID=A0ABT0L7Y5_9GAMM|nr:hypothetical protein [Shewanella surugensis]MCL1123654.1 hypothetical protein [Shewanella surugensis]